MPFRESGDHLRDILEAIAHIDTFLGAMDFAEYKLDQKTKSAVERQMQIITEAAVRLGDDGRALCPGLDWNGYRGMGNLLRHAYHRVDDKVIWDTVKHELPLMRQAILSATG